MQNEVSMSLDTRLLLITKELGAGPKGGRELLCRLNHDVLQSIFLDNFLLFELRHIAPMGTKEIFRSFKGDIDGIRPDVIERVVSIIDKNNVTHVFVDGSNLGGLVSAIKRAQPRVEIITFFHNAEARFFWGAFVAKRSLRAFGVLFANYLAERKSVVLSDKRVCLSRRDSDLIKRLYGYQATHIAPMVLVDKFTSTHVDRRICSYDEFALFVGGTFYANQQGIEWFVREVVPSITIPIVIVGRGFEAYRDSLEIPDRVKVIGAVDDLSAWYHQAKFIIAPIFDGSGMKTKVAEALMYGKKVVGSREAFSGYEDIIEQVGWECNTREEFVEAVHLASTSITCNFYPELREIFIRNYSFDAARKRFISLFYN